MAAMGSGSCPHQAKGMCPTCAAKAKKAGTKPSPFMPGGGKGKTPMPAPYPRGGNRGK